MADELHYIGKTDCKIRADVIVDILMNYTYTLNDLVETTEVKTSKASNLGVVWLIKLRQMYSTQVYYTSNIIITEYWCEHRGSVLILNTYENYDYKGTLLKI